MVTGFGRPPGIADILTISFSADYARGERCVLFGHMVGADHSSHEPGAITGSSGQFGSFYPMLENAP